MCTCACVCVCVSGRGCGVTFWDKKAVVQLTKEELGSLAWGGGQDSAFALAMLSQTLPFSWPCPLPCPFLQVCSHLCRLTLLSSLHCFPLPRGGFSALALTPVCPLSLCPLPVLGGGKEKARHGRLSQPWQSLPPRPRSLHRTPQLEGPDPSCHPEKVMPQLVGSRGLVI